MIEEEKSGISKEDQEKLIKAVLEDFKKKLDEGDPNANIMRIKLHITLLQEVFDLLPRLESCCLMVSKISFDEMTRSFGKMMMYVITLSRGLIKASKQENSPEPFEIFISSLHLIASKYDIDIDAIVKKSEEMMPF